MSRSVTLAAVLLTAAVSIGIYRLAYEVQRLEDELVEYNRALLVDREAIQVLHAEWSYLTRPESLQERAVRILPLQPLLPPQIARFADLPDRPPAMPDADGTPPVVIPIPKPAFKPKPKGPAPAGEADVVAGLPARPPFQIPQDLSVLASMKVSE